MIDFLKEVWRNFTFMLAILGAVLFWVAVIMVCLAPAALAIAIGPWYWGLLYLIIVPLIMTIVDKVT